MTLTPIVNRGPERRPLVCFKCGVTGKADPTVYARITITGEHQPPLCSWCATKLDRAARMSRRGDCEQ